MITKRKFDSFAWSDSIFLTEQVTGNNPDRGKHFENDASLHSGPSDSAVIPAEERHGLHEKDDSPIIQRTAHGSDSSNCSSGGILIEDTSNSAQAKKILMASKVNNDFHMFFLQNTNAGTCT